LCAKCVYVDYEGGWGERTVQCCGAVLRSADGCFAVRVDAEWQDYRKELVKKDRSRELSLTTGIKACERFFSIKSRDSHNSTTPSAFSIVLPLTIHHSEIFTLTTDPRHAHQAVREAGTDFFYKLGTILSKVVWKAAHLDTNDHASNHNIVIVLRNTTFEQ